MKTTNIALGTLFLLAVAWAVFGEPVTARIEAHQRGEGLVAHRVDARADTVRVYTKWGFPEGEYVRASR